MESELTSFYCELSRRLKWYGYESQLSLESAFLVNQLLNDVIQAVQNFETLTDRYSQLKKTLTKTQSLYVERQMQCYEVKPLDILQSLQRLREKLRIKELSSGAEKVHGEIRSLKLSLDASRKKVANLELEIATLKLRVQDQEIENKMIKEDHGTDTKKPINSINKADKIKVEKQKKEETQQINSKKASNKIADESAMEEKEKPGLQTEKTCPENALLPGYLNSRVFELSKRLNSVEELLKLQKTANNKESQESKNADAENIINANAEINNLKTEKNQLKSTLLDKEMAAKSQECLINAQKSKHSEEINQVCLKNQQLVNEIAVQKKNVSSVLQELEDSNKELINHLAFQKIAKLLHGYILSKTKMVTGQIESWIEKNDLLKREKVSSNSYAEFIQCSLAADGFELIEKLELIKWSPADFDNVLGKAYSIKFVEFSNLNQTELVNGVYFKEQCMMMSRMLMGTILILKTLFHSILDLQNNLKAERLRSLKIEVEITGRDSCIKRLENEHLGMKETIKSFHMDYGLLKRQLNKKEKQFNLLFHKISDLEDDLEIPKLCLPKSSENEEENKDTNSPLGPAAGNTNKIAAASNSAKQSIQ